MLAQEILNKKEEQGKHKVYTVHIDTSVFDAISRLDQLKIGSLLVINDKSELMGIVSERDILYKCYNSGIPLKEQKIEKEQLITENKKEADSIKNEKISQEGLVKQIKKKEKKYISIIKKKQLEEKEIDRKIEKIIREAIAKSNKELNIKGSGFKLTPEAKILEKSFVANKGKLPAPVKRGVVVRHYGKQSHPTLKGITIESNGVFYATEKGSNARVVFNGKVLAIQVLPGKKKAVLIQHGNYISVYKNLDNVTVQKGELVKTKQEIGKIHTDKTTGKTILAFVLFKEIKRENPEEWVYKI